MKIIRRIGGSVAPHRPHSPQQLSSDSTAMGGEREKIRRLQWLSVDRRHREQNRGGKARKAREEAPIPIPPERT